MKVGDYVRTPLGITKYIGKYDNYEGFYEFDKLDEELWTGDIANVVYACEIDNIVLKSSPNIIDLIEVGDYVNGMRVSEILKRGREIKYIRFMADSDYECYIELKEEEIETILTKEQFESMEYKVGD